LKTITENHNQWTPCARKLVPRSSYRKINPTKPIPKHKVLSPPSNRRWETALIPNIKPTIYNYYEPLSYYAHYHDKESEMVRDKAKVAVDMRQRMMNLRYGEATQQQATTITNYGRGGGHTGEGRGRGGGSRDSRQNKTRSDNEERSKYTSTTSETSASAERQMKEMPTVTCDEAPTISDLTEETQQAQEMETEEDILAPISSINIPKQI
jgi:hypothetical protein